MPSSLTVSDGGGLGNGACHDAAGELPYPPRTQGESICYDRSGRHVFLTSEKLPTPLFRVSLGDRTVQEAALDRVIEKAGDGN